MLPDWRLRRESLRAPRRPRDARRARQTRGAAASRRAEGGAHSCRASRASAWPRLRRWLRLRATAADRRASRAASLRPRVLGGARRLWRTLRSRRPGQRGLRGACPGRLRAIPGGCGRALASAHHASLALHRERSTAAPSNASSPRWCRSKRPRDVDRAAAAPRAPASGAPQSPPPARVGPGHSLLIEQPKASGPIWHVR